jgi:dTDP-glucose 4,6-dehydratase
MATDRYLVIGSNSFSGASFVAGALAAGAEVVGISRSPELDDVMLPYKWAPHTRFSFHQLDINYDLEKIDALAREFQPTYVVNFAAQGMVAQSWSCPEHWFRTNTVAMVNLHDRLRKLPCLRKFVQASTPEVYGTTSGLVRETEPYNPSTPYAISKAACDMSLTAFHRAYGFPVVFTRAANVCGPGQQLYRIIPKTILFTMTGRKLKLEGGGHSVRSFIHIRDVVEGTLRAAQNGTPGSIFHLATDRNQTIRALVEEICLQMGVDFEDCVEVTEGRLGQDSAYLLDWSKARSELGWAPALTVKDAIRDTIDWMKRNLKRVREMPADYIHKP